MTGSHLSPSGSARRAFSFILLIQESTSPRHLFKFTPKPAKEAEDRMRRLLPVRRDDGANTAGIKQVLHPSCDNVPPLTLWLSSLMPCLTSSDSNSRVAFACEDSANVTRNKAKELLQ